jgi:hypothetical protein
VLRVPPEERDDFPRAGVRARRWRRFERDLEAWLATPVGRFARWSARQSLKTAEAELELCRSPRAR